MRLAAGSIVICGLFLGGCSAAPSLKPPSNLPSTPPGGTNETPLGTAPAPQATPKAPFELQRITAQALKARMDQGESILIADVRGPGSYDLLHIAGAVSLPGAQYLEWGATLDKEKPIVFY